MEYTLRASVEYPQVRFLNCSIGLPHQSVRSYFGKMYEAKFLLGALAASMADNHRIGYHASVFASGALSEINAFAIGASLLDPRAQIILTWGDVPAGGLAEAMCREGVSVMSGADMSKPLEDPTAYGLHRLVDGKVAGIAMPVWNWGRYYELIVRSLLHGTWDETSDDSQVRAVNYWYGMSSGVIDIRYAPGLPYQTRKLVQLLRNGIVEAPSIHLAASSIAKTAWCRSKAFPRCRARKSSRWTGWQTTWWAPFRSPTMSRRSAPYENPCHSRYRRTMPLGVLSQRTL